MIATIWNRIKEWGVSNAPEMLGDLNPGAAEEDISALEAELGCQMPADFKESLKIHNGESDGWPCKVFADCGAYLGTDRIIEAWKQRLAIAEEMSEHGSDIEDVEEQIREGFISVEGEVRPAMFLREWIPIMDSNGDIFWAIDLNPAEGGKPGQIIAVDWEGCSWKVVAGSFAEFIQQYADRLERGEYRIVDGLPTMEDDA